MPNTAIISMSSDKELAKLEDVLGKQLADAEERYNSLESSKDELKAEVYDEKKRNLLAELAELKGKRNMWDELDKHFSENGELPIFKPDSEKAIDTLEGAFLNALGDKKSKIETEDEIDTGLVINDITRRNPLYAAVGDATTSDATASQVFTSQTVEYLLRPISLINFIGKESIPTQTMRWIYEDTAKNEGGYAPRSEGGNFAQIDYGTKQESRDVVSIGVFFNFTEELMHDGNRSHFLPYARARLSEDMGVYVENETVKGPGTGTPVRMKGFLTETGVQTLPASIAGNDGTSSNGDIKQTASDHAVLDYLLDGITQIRTTAFTNPNLIVLHPTDYARFLKLKDDNKMYVHIFNQVNAPLGATIPTLWGVPITQSLAVAQNEFIILDTNRVKLYYMAHMPSRLREGYIGENMKKNTRTIILDTYVNQYTRRPKAIWETKQLTS